MGGAAMSMSRSGKGGRKTVDAAINLVPFIDLLSCCLSFLLITAVWSQLAAVPATHGQGSVGEANQIPDVKLMLSLSPSGFVLTRSTGEQTRIERHAEALDLPQLGVVMRKVKQEYPQKTDITLRSTDGVIYDDLIKTIDTLRAAQFSDVHVSEKPADT